MANPERYRLLKSVGAFARKMLFSQMPVLHFSSAPKTPIMLLLLAGIIGGPAKASFVQAAPKLIGSGATGDAKQGISVALSTDGNTAIVGGFNDNNRVGAAWVWVRSAGVWTQQAKLVGSGATGEPCQGRFVALSADGNTALVGGFSDNRGSGAA